MAQNPDPIYGLFPHTEWCVVTTANTGKDGTGTIGTNMGLLWTSHATAGSYLERLFLQPQGSQVATVLRLYWNNGSTNATAANNSYFKQYSLPLVTNSETAAILGFEVYFNLGVDAGYRLYAAIGTTATGWALTANGSYYA